MFVIFSMILYNQTDKINCSNCEYQNFWCSGSWEDLKKNNLMKRGLALFKQFRIIYAETDTTQNVIVKAHLGFQLR